jgi:hypothetical protein
LRVLLFAPSPGDAARFVADLKPTKESSSLRRKLGTAHGKQKKRDNGLLIEHQTNKGSTGRRAGLRIFGPVLSGSQTPPGSVSAHSPPCSAKPFEGHQQPQLAVDSLA